MARTDKLYILAFAGLGAASSGTGLVSILCSGNPIFWGTLFGLLVVGCLFMVITVVKDSGKGK